MIRILFLPIDSSSRIARACGDLSQLLLRIVDAVIMSRIGLMWVIDCAAYVDNAQMTPAIRPAVIPQTLMAIVINQIPVYSRWSNLPYAVRSNEVVLAEAEGLQLDMHQTTRELTIIYALQYEVNANVKEQRPRHASGNVI